CTENRRQQNPLRFHGTPTPSSHKHTLNDASFLIQLLMECNREELRLLLTAERLSGCGSLQGGSAHRRYGRRNSRRLRAKTQLLKGFRIQLAGGIQPMGFLELSRRFHRRSVPLPVRLPCERTVFRERLLDLGNAFRGGSFLPPLPPARSPGSSFPARRPGSLGRRLLRRSRLGLRRARKQTEPRRQQQLQGQVGRFLDSHSNLFGFAQSLVPQLLLSVSRYLARQIERQHPVAVLPAKNLEDDVFAMLQLRHRLAVISHRGHRFAVDRRNYVAAAKAQVISSLYGLPVHAGDHVTALQSGLLRRTARLDTFYNHAVRSTQRFQRNCVGAQLFLKAYADGPACHPPLLDDLVVNVDGCRRRQRKAHAFISASARDNCGIDSD